MAALTLAGIVYLLAIREFFAGGGARATQEFPRRVVVIGLVLAAVWHIAFLRVPPGADDDIHRYVWDGRLQRLGYNPYLVVPSHPALAALHTPETRSLNHPDLPSPYPAGAELFFRAVAAIHESVFALKVAFVVCDFAIVFVLLDILRRSGQGAHWVLAYAWNPLLAIEVAGSGHIDIVGVLLLLVSFAALERRWRACCRPDIWAGCFRKIATDCIAATLLEAGSHSRRGAGCSRGRASIRAISQSWQHSDRLAGYVYP